MPRAQPPTILDLPPEQARRFLGGWLADRGEPPFRLRQLVPRLWQSPAISWRAVTDLPLALRDALEAEFPIPRLTLRHEQESADGTRKFLWGLPDAEAIESVWIPEGRRRTLCISSQVGCALGCVFCATGTMGLKRHLAPWEIAAQVRELLIIDPALAPTNVVYMGMGEPLHNWTAVDTSLTILNHGDGLGIGARRITVSTVGLLPNLEKFVKRPEQFRLAVSLHGATPETRRALMPVEKRYPLPDVLEALEGLERRVTLEYVMIDGKNDSPADARALAEVATRLGAHVNLLPLHPGGAAGLTPSPNKRIRSFASMLTTAGVEAVVRRSRGLDIAAACGQLRVEVGA